MARIRTIKPEFCQSESIGRLSREARLLFVLLWTFVDDHGRARGNSRLLAANLYPFDDDAGKHIDGWLEELERENCIRRYIVDGTTYLDIPNWAKHQRIDNAGKSKIPEFRGESPRTAADDGEPRQDAAVRGLDLGPRTIGPRNSSSLRSEGGAASPAAEEPPDCLPFHPDDDFVPEDIPSAPEPDPPPPQPVAAPAQDLAPKKPGDYPSVKAWAYAAAKQTIGPRGGPIIGQLLKLYGEDFFKINDLLKAAANAADPAQYLFGVIAKMKKREKQQEVEQKQVEAWKPKNGNYPASDERGWFIKSEVDGGRLYLDAEKVQKLVGDQRERRGTM